MTRETKIGLLVGLAFIIVIGILLSDHLTTATEPQQAYLPQVAPNVRSGVMVPGAGRQPQITAPVTVAPATPPQPVPTIQDLAPRPAPVQIVQIGPSGDAAAQPPPQSQHPPVTLPPIASAQAPQATAVQPPPVSVVPPTHQPAPVAEAPVTPSQPAVITTPAPTSAGGVLAAIARRYGEDVVDADGTTDRPPQQQPTQVALAPAAPEALAPGAKQYKAVAGDSLSKIAAKVYGTSSPAMQDAIARANPSLQKDPNLIIAGRTYVIPAVSGTAPPPPGTSAPAQIAAAPAPAAQPEYIYKVREGDTLWKIAAEQLGNAAAVAAIKDLNQDVLKGSDLVRPNMKLRLPAKPVATAS